MFTKMFVYRIVPYFIIWYVQLAAPDAAAVIRFKFHEHSDYIFNCTNDRDLYKFDEVQTLSVVISSEYNLTVNTCWMHSKSLNYSSPSYKHSDIIDTQFHIYNVSRSGFLFCEFMGFGESNVLNNPAVTCAASLKFKDVIYMDSSKYTVSYYLIPSQQKLSFKDTFNQPFMAKINCYCDRRGSNKKYEEDICQLQINDRRDPGLEMTKLFKKNWYTQTFTCLRRDEQEKHTLSIAYKNNNSLVSETPSAAVDYVKDESNNIVRNIAVSVLCLCLLATIGYFVTKRLARHCRERAAARSHRNQVAGDGSRPRLPTPIYDQPFDISTGYEDRIRRLKVAILLGKKQDDGTTDPPPDPVPLGCDRKPRTPPMVMCRPRLPTPPDPQRP